MLYPQGMTTAAQRSAKGPTGGLRERKKRETWMALHRAALGLVEDRGLDDVTIDEIAAQADVSARTFFNYFPSKDAAVLGSQPDDLERLAALVAERPAGEAPLEVMRHVSRTLLAPTSADPQLRLMRSRVLLSEPSLAPALLGRNVRIEDTVTAALERRLGLTPGADLRPRVLAATVLAATRACMEHHQQGATGSLEDSIDEAFDVLAAGLR